MSDIPTVVTKAGLQPRTPAELRTELTNNVSATNPGYTANLPGSLIEDITSTDVGAVSLLEQARVDLINSITPYGANVFLLTQLGNIYGVPAGQSSNTSVEVVFSGDVGQAGLVIPQGFTVSDGTHQYVLTSGGVVQSDGTTIPLHAVATLPGSWPVIATSVNQIATSLPPGITLAVSNPLDGLPGADAEEETAYRAEVLAAGLAGSQGMPRFLKTLLRNVAGVQMRLVSVRIQTGGFWEIIVGGGDQYEIANAIYEAMFDVSTLVGSVMVVENITKANPGVVSTLLNHGFTTGNSITLNGAVGMPQVNGNTYTATVIDQKTFSIGVNTSGFGTYVSGGVVTPNNRNVVVSIEDHPDTYAIPIVRPPQQTVLISVAWNTNSPNFVADAAVAQLAIPALADYINSLSVGRPILTSNLGDVFQNAVQSVLPPDLLTRLVFTVTINGIITAPVAGMFIINGDPESYFFALNTGITVGRG